MSRGADTRRVDVTTAALPLLRRTAEGTPDFVLTPRPRARRASTPPTQALRMPDRAPGPGEQYRFHVDMGACIGCKCCVVACNEQNGNPAAINWRRVAEIEGGWYPDAHQHYLSMGCNHCLEPTCLAGCPVDAYTKDPATGLVQHSADACIGCQYCTWNCSYGVPQYNAERGVVGKCDMCHGRLSLGQSPACVAACPEGAIRVEVVQVEAWRRAVTAAPAGDGLPREDGSLSTTRVTMPQGLPPDARARPARIEPQDPHWPLVIMTVLTQLSVGTLVTVFLLQLLGGRAALGAAAIVSFGVAALALGASTLHLGRPVHALRALRMWRRSWLSREVLLFGLFSGAAAVYAGALWIGLPWAYLPGAATTVLGVAGVAASGCIYRVTSRGTWNTPLTPAAFLLTAGVLGPLLAGAVGAGDALWLAAASAVMASAQLVVLALRYVRLAIARHEELRGAARLLATVLAPWLAARGALLVAGGIVMPLLLPTPVGLAAALLTATTGELVGRYLFFVSALPTHVTSAYLPLGSEVAA